MLEELNQRNKNATVIKLEHTEEEPKPLASDALKSELQRSLLNPESTTTEPRTNANALPVLI